MSALLGRDAETREMARLIGRAATAGQAVVMLGEPGIGKTALLGAAAELARAAGFQVLAATGVESETQFPFAGMHQVLRPVLGATERLPAVHRRALLTAFGLADGPRPEFYLISLAAVSLVGAAVPDGFDVVIDTVGGAVLDGSYGMTRRGGRLVTLGARRRRSGRRRSAA